MRAERIPVMALTSLLCGLGSVGWLRDFGNSSLAALPIGLLLVVAGVGFAVSRFLSILGQSAIVRFVAVSLCCLFALPILISWPGRIGEYAIPLVPDSAGILVCLAALVAGGLSLALSERRYGTVVFSMLLAVYVLITAFLYDPLTRSPYFVVRRFASAASQDDQAGMIPYFSRESLRHFDELPTTSYGNEDGSATGSLKTVGYLHGVGARNSLLYGIHITGNTAIADCSVPWHGEEDWNMFQFRGHGATVYLIREDGEWKIDAWRSWKESPLYQLSHE